MCCLWADGWETHRVEDPRRTVPARGIEHGPQVEEEHSCDSSAAHVVCRVLFRFRDLDVRTDNPQADGTTCSADQQQVTPTDAVNQI